MKEFRQFSTCHSHPQSLDSGSTPLAFCEREVELGSPTLTVTDHGTLASAHTVYKLATAGKWSNGKPKPKLTPIVGLEAYFRDDDCPILGNLGIPKTPKPAKGWSQSEWDRRYPNGTYLEYNKYYHITMGFLDYEAYLCAVRRLSRADDRAEVHGSERKPLFDWADVEELAAHNTTATTSCLVGIVQRHLMGQDNLEAATQYFHRMRSLFGDRFYVELFPHSCTHDYTEGDVFVTVGDPAAPEVIRYRFEKKLRTDAGEVSAKALADGFKEGATDRLLAHSHYRKWHDYEQPRQILSVKSVQGFVENECRPWHHNSDIQEGCNRFVLDLARRYNVPILIGDDSHFAKETDKIVQDVRLAQSNWHAFHTSYHRQSSAEAYAHFQRTLGTTEAEFEGWIEGTHAWAERFKNFRFNAEPSLPTKFYPTDTLKHTRGIIEKHDRLSADPVRMKRLKAEIEMFHKNGVVDLLPYFFVDEEVCQFFERIGKITGPGRGSAAGLLLAYLEGITHVDPIKYGLSMERFMTPDRIKSGKLPDIDQDIPKKHRDLLLDPETGWLFKRFGDHVAQISVDTTLKLKNAVKDVSRLKRGYVPPEIETWCKHFDEPPMGVTDLHFVLGYKNEGDGSWVPGSLERDANLQSYVNAYPDDWEIVKKCLGLTRQKGRHACAHVIANRPIHEFIPLTSVSGVRVTAYTAAGVEAVGGLKMDFLGVGGLDDIGDAIQFVQERHCQDIDWSQYKIIEHEEDAVGWSGRKPSTKRFSVMIDGRRVPSQRLVPLNGRLYDVWDLPEDQAVFQDVSEGRTETVFQFNTPGSRQWLAHFNHRRPDGTKAINSIEAMAAFTALDRPGPLDIEVQNPEEPDQKHNMLVEFARRARGAIGSQDVLPVFDQLVPETYGVMTYQEQLQRVYQYLTDCSGSEAEEFRSNVAKKMKEKVDAAQPFFLARAGAKIGEDNALKVWGFFKTWAQYGFNKSHAVCYAVVAYAGAFLKHHYPLEWWCSVLLNAKKEEIVEKFWPYCNHLALLPDIQKSGPQWQIEGDKIRAPLNVIRGMGDAAQAQLNAGLPYTSIEDFIQKGKAYRIARGGLAQRKKKSKSGEETFEEVFKLGTNALHRGIIRSLIVSGVLASLFPPGASPDECLSIYDSAWRIIYDTNKKERPYPSLDPIGRYQLKKHVISIGGDDLRPIVQYAGLPTYLKMADTRRMRYIHKSWDRRTRREILQETPVIGVERLEAIDSATQVPEHGLMCAVLAYVESSKQFLYHKETKEARKLQLDVGGAKYNLVHWPDYNTGTLPSEVANCKAGSIVVALLEKRQAGKELAIKSLQVIRPPVNLKEEENVAKSQKPDGSD